MSNHQQWFTVGRGFNSALPADSIALRPSKLDIQFAAAKLGITSSDARRALDFFNFGGPDSPPAIKQN